MTDERIAQQRLHLQHLVTPTLTNPADVVRTLGAVQAQDYAAAKWAIGQRTIGARDADVEWAIVAGEIIRTHVLRPTWHFVAPEDLRWMLALTAPRVSAAMGHYNRKLGFDAGVFRKSNAAIARALRDGQHLTRAELAAALGRSKVNVATGQHVAHLLMQAELDGFICGGVRRGKQFTYALLDAHVPLARAWDRDESLIELARRYFATRGPATLHDFSWWSGLTIADAKRAVAGLGKFLERFEQDDRTLWFAPSAGVPGRSPRLAHLLPNYDEYFVGFKDRRAIGARLRRAIANPRIDALMGHIVFVDGQIVGGWTRSATKRGIDLDLLVQLRPSEHQRVDAQIKRFVAFRA